MSGYLDTGGPTSDTGKEPVASATATEPSPWRPILVRGWLGAVALLGLAGIGGLSMVAGLDGARASPPSSATAMVAAPPSVAPLVKSATGPTQGDTTTVATGAASASSPPAPGCAARLPDGRVVLNRATIEDLRAIPGIGPKRAASILALRERLHRFRRPSDLLRVRGIGPKSLSRMQPHFVVDPPDGATCPTP